MGRGDFYSDLSERNREVFCQNQRGVLFFLHVPGSPLFFSISFFVSSSPPSFSVSFSVYSSPLSRFHHLSPQSPLRTFSVYHAAKVWGLQNRFLKFFDFVASLSLLLSPCTHCLSLFLSWCTSRFNRLFFLIFFIMRGF